MCGIFGLVAPARAQFKEQIDDLFTLSESRGKEAAGLAIRVGNNIAVYKRPVAASRMIREPGYRHLLSDMIGQAKGARVAVIGHSRLVTNGAEADTDNNQPVVKDGLVAIHNGIIVNDADLWLKHPHLKRDYQVDTEVFLALLADIQANEKCSLPNAAARVFSLIEGTASMAILPSQESSLLLATNSGSLYVNADPSGQWFAFASERFILETFLAQRARKTGQKSDPVRGLIAGQGMLVDLDSGYAQDFTFDSATRARKKEDYSPAPAIITNLAKLGGPEAAQLKRCTRCILPETMPFIHFDTEGVCNYCRTYEPVRPLGLEALRELVAPYRSKNGEPDCMVAVSGGRDSCYGLHVLKKELSLNPVAYTYDWGLITDLARRNQARLCGKLGVEHILVSADIRQKRAFVRNNLQAWLKRPHLGMIPILMAGDKQYFYFAEQTRRRMNLKLSFLCENKLERAHFKAGFMGIEEGHGRTFNISLGQKIKTALAYGQQYLVNPGYINRSLLDTLDAYYCSYFLPHDQLQLFNYAPWEEEQLVSLLRSEYNWELATDTVSSWRIGDGTAAFYNYVYYMVAGFTENDTLRSNQIRQGVMDREQALKMVAIENRPRWESLQWYANVIGFNLYEALEIVNAMPKLYRTEREI
ncbi:MAG: hypothetical protein HQL43_00325 [Alphaproteobacteria bacterium]|nr:hypothetical protein [Alphaproteobacteria bacterium]